MAEIITLGLFIISIVIFLAWAGANNWQKDVVEDRFFIEDTDSDEWEGRFKYPYNETTQKELYLNAHKAILWALKDFMDFKHIDIHWVSADRKPLRPHDVDPKRPLTDESGFAMVSVGLYEPDETITSVSWQYYSEEDHFEVDPRRLRKLETRRDAREEAKAKMSGKGQNVMEEFDSSFMNQLDSIDK